MCVIEQELKKYWILWIEILKEDSEHWVECNIKSCQSSVKCETIHAWMLLRNKGLIVTLSMEFKHFFFSVDGKIEH